LSSALLNEYIPCLILSRAEAKVEASSDLTRPESSDYSIAVLADNKGAAHTVAREIAFVKSLVQSWIVLILMETSEYKISR
jgi:hypothetical protein